MKFIEKYRKFIILNKIFRKISQADLFFVNKINKNIESLKGKIYSLTRHRIYFFVYNFRATFQEINLLDTKI